MSENNVIESTVAGINWWMKGDEGTPIPEEHKERLQECAKERILEMVEQDYSSGELCTSIYDHETNEEIEYHGWWGS